jgi:plastocyanin
MKTTIYGKVIIAVALIFSFAISSCKKDSTSPAAPATNGTKSGNEVSIENMAFSPSSLTVTSGTTVKWTNNDGVTHTVTSDKNTFDSGNLNSSKTFSFTFATAGTYKYHCSIHTTMTGTIVVQ